MKLYIVRGYYGYGHCGDLSEYQTEVAVFAPSGIEAQKRWELAYGTRHNPTPGQLEDCCPHCGCPENGRAEWREAEEAIPIEFTNDSYTVEGVLPIHITTCIGEL